MKRYIDESQPGEPAGEFRKGIGSATLGPHKHKNSKEQWEGFYCPFIVRHKFVDDYGPSWGKRTIHFGQDVLNRIQIKSL